MSKYKLNTQEYKRCAREVAANSCVLIKNEKNTLPLKKSDNIAIFGRSAFNYYKSGLGSGGLVNTRYVMGILDALKACEQVNLNEELLQIYQGWIADNPFEHGVGWGKVPWSQKEMPLDRTMVKKARDKSDVALIIIGRTAGEDQDTKDEAGSYRLTDIEESMINNVTSVFEQVVVILNVGNIIDMSWVEKYNPSAVLYVWQGGQEGGRGVADVLTGQVVPSGKLSDTIAKNISDYPSTPYFGNDEVNFYKEDIYVGYRYFETFAKDKVLYPYGYGLSYTTFKIEGQVTEVLSNKISIKVKVTNTGQVAGREVIQVYVEAPQGKLGKPARSLVAFAKTDTIQAGKSDTLDLVIDKYKMASYDDSGITGHKSCYVMEEGSYQFYLGYDVRKAKNIGSYVERFTILEKLHEALAPVKQFERIKPLVASDGSYALSKESVPTRVVDIEKEIESELGKAIDFTGDVGYKLKDVVEGKIDIDQFIAQLSDEDMACIVRGEGMCSPKVTPGTAAAFGGITQRLKDYGIPVACCADGPSGIRIDCGTKAFSLPNGTAMACTFDVELIEDMSMNFGLEIRKNKVDVILAPGINIHRNPLNGRNFEYFSEDPLLTGAMAAAQIKGMAYAGVTGTLKHFVANNQEVGRRSADAIISERALREIYLKGFEIAVKAGGAYAVMTSYGPVNGLWTAGSYDLCTTILRNEWGFDGLVMTDWWAEANFEGEKSKTGNTASMIRAQNDVYMCVNDSEKNTENDNTIEMLNTGFITRWQLQRGTRNILKFIMRSPVMLYALGKISQEELDEIKEADQDETSYGDAKRYLLEGDELVIDASDMDTKSGSSAVFALTFGKYGYYDISFRMKSDLDVLAQLSVSVFMDNQLKTTIAVQGSNGQLVEETDSIGAVIGPNHYLRLYFGQTGLDIETITIRLIKKL